MATIRPQRPSRRIAVAARLGDTALRERLALVVASEPDLVWSEGVADVLIADVAWSAPQETTPMVLVGDVDLLELSPTVRALLPTDASPTTIVSAVRLVARGLLIVPDDAVERLAEIAHERNEEEEDDRAGPSNPLTSREQEVLQLLAAGATNKVIARQLDVSVHTVKFHVASLLRKLGASTRLEAVGIGLRTGLLLV